MGFGLKDRVVVVTGATRGVGQALASAFACEGVRLGLLARDARALADVAGRLPAEVVPAACEVSDADAVAEAFDQIADRWGRVDSVVVNAGLSLTPRHSDGDISLEPRRVQNLPLPTWHRLLAVNLTGAFLTVRAAYQHLLPSHRGRVVFVSSVMARTPRHGVSGYAASKAGVEGLTRAVAADWAADNICVNAVAPGFINAGRGRIVSGSGPMQDDVLPRIPFRRLGTATELANTVLFLAGDAAGFLTGQVIAVDGGYGLD
ncbi:SDR family NAD(P)-dependent oxidoreductase [Amycolatopsis alkalitolerans]|uniref:SDR family oxidoreductase n=1 Tax=Amycolatopsis alkalitolerans TaxID=2547244 RepID=A0A5C4LR32_9PSEU|nr:SDR family NAD(P)-dependent oxidoreductase [Amycolatopsis alkalitolerans]TNC19272.1 SDR family oxidoreductase [Amycolatopsis alkalitolerans]